eukprot:592787-Pelagomonas_calceolata.AAC.1
MGFAQHPILLGAYFDFYEASPVICMVTCITGGLVIVASGFVCVFFAHWAPAKLAAWVLCQPSGSPCHGAIGFCTGFVEYSLEIACAFADAANPECSGSRDHSRSQVAVMVFGVVDGQRGGISMGAE